MSKLLKYLIVIIFIISLKFISNSNELESVIIDFRSPFYDEKGELTTELIAARTYLLPNGHSNIEHLKINFFENNKVISSIYLPKCKTLMYFKDGKKTFKIETDDDVLVIHNNLTIIGKGFKFDPSVDYFEILSNVRILGKIEDLGSKYFGL